MKTSVIQISVMAQSQSEAGIFGNSLLFPSLVLFLKWKTSGCTSATKLLFILYALLFLNINMVHVLVREVTFCYIKLS